MSLGWIIGGAPDRPGRRSIQISRIKAIPPGFSVRCIFLNAPAPRRCHAIQSHEVPQ